MENKESLLTEFEQLPVSTMTIMVYSNMNYDLKTFFKDIYVSDISPPLTKKHQRIDKKKIRAPYGNIYSTVFGNEFRGLDLRKKKKKIGKKTIEYFLNQVMIFISLGEININIMLFRDNFKIAGCKTYDDAMEVTMLLWEEFIKPTQCYTFKNKETEPKFIHDCVMKNFSFKFDFNIHRMNLNNMMNRQEYKDKVHLSQFEATDSTNVRIKMYSNGPHSNKYHMLTYKPEPALIFYEGNYRDDDDFIDQSKKRKTKQFYITFIVFSSGEVIITGRYENNMKDMYHFFTDLVLKNKDDISEYYSA
jgi:hypothetical protein